MSEDNHLAIRLDHETLAKLRAFAELRGVTTSALVCDLIRQELRKQRIRDSIATFNASNRKR